LPTLIGTCKHFEDGSWVSKLYAIAPTAAFAVMSWIFLGYHLIGITGQLNENCPVIYGGS